MKTEMKKWEIERIGEIISDILQLWNYDFIEVNDGHGRAMSMSKETFLEKLEKELSDN